MPVHDVCTTLSPQYAAASPAFYRAKIRGGRPREEAYGPGDVGALVAGGAAGLAVRALVRRRRAVRPHVALLRADLVAVAARLFGQGGKMHGNHPSAHVRVVQVEPLQPLGQLHAPLPLGPELQVPPAK